MHKLYPKHDVLLGELDMPTMVTLATAKWASQKEQAVLHVVTIAMICSTLASLWKFQYFRGPICNPVKHVWWGFLIVYSCNCKPLSIFTKKLHRRYLLASKYASVFRRLWKRFISVFYIRRFLKSVIPLKYFTSSNSSNLLLTIYSLNHLTY